MATYKTIIAHVRDQAGFVAKTCWIAHVMSDHGLTQRLAHNRINKDYRTHPCPSQRRFAIEQALRQLGVISS